MNIFENKISIRIKEVEDSRIKSDLEIRMGELDKELACLLFDGAD